MQKYSSLYCIVHKKAVLLPMISTAKADRVLPDPSGLKKEGTRGSESNTLIINNLQTNKNYEKVNVSFCKPSDDDECLLLETPSTDVQRIARACATGYHYPFRAI